MLLALLTAASLPAPLTAQGPLAPEGSRPDSLPATPSATLYREGFAMGTTLRVTVPLVSSRSAALGASEAAFREVERMEALLSSWRPDSPLSQLNRSAPGLPSPVHPELRRLLERALAWTHRTGGAFDPRLGALVDAWDLRGSGRHPTDPEIGAALLAVGPRGMTLGRDGMLRHHPSAWMDSGGFGKGAALASLADTLEARKVTGALVDLGGQLLAVGAPEDDPRGWRLGVAHPAHRDRGVAVLRLRGASVATSGSSERGIRVDGRRFGHILDPRTGHPVPSWGSVTVVSTDPLEADILATALYVLGPDAGMELARTLRETGVLFLAGTGEVLDATWNRAMERWLEPPLPSGTPDGTQPPEPPTDP